MASSKYSVELYSRNGDLLADLSGRARDRRVRRSRNEADEINWEIDLHEFEDYCARSGVEPTALLINGQTEVKIRRGQNYIGAGRLVYHETRISADTKTISLRAIGWLNLLARRYIVPEVSVSGVQATTAAWSLIDDTQSLAHGDFGITLGSLEAVGTITREFNRITVKDALQDLTRSQDTPFDIEITHDKVFNAVASLGSDRPDVVFEYPGNIISVGVPSDATGLANQVLAYGDGLDTPDGVFVTVDDEDSQIEYDLAQKIIMLTGNDDDGAITDAGNSELDAWAYPIDIPSIVVDGNKAPYVTDFSIGDYVKVKLGGYAMINHINGLYRVEKYDLDIDDNDNERLTLYLSE